MVYREARYFDYGDVTEGRLVQVPTFDVDVAFATPAEVTQVAEAFETWDSPEMADRFRAKIEEAKGGTDNTADVLVHLAGEDLRQLLPVASLVGIETTTVQSFSPELSQRIAHINAAEKLASEREMPLVSDDSAEYRIPMPFTVEEDGFPTRFIYPLSQKEFNTWSFEHIAPQVGSVALESTQAALAAVKSTAYTDTMSAIPAVQEYPYEEQAAEESHILSETAVPAHHHRHRAHGHESYRPQSRRDHHAPQHRAHNAHNSNRLAKTGAYLTHRLVARLLSRQD